MALQQITSRFGFSPINDISDMHVQFLLH